MTVIRSSIRAVIYLSGCFMMICSIAGMWNFFNSMLILTLKYEEFDIRIESVFTNTIEKMPSLKSGKFQKWTRNSTTNFGFVLADNFVDQLTGANLNLLTLQCWASTLQDDNDSRQVPMGLSNKSRVLVVEPFIRNGSVFGVDFKQLLMNKSNSSLLIMSDLFDKGYWQQYTIRRGYRAHLATWEYFLRNAPRKLIIVYSRVYCPSPADCEQSELFHSFAENYGFEVVRIAQYDTRQPWLSPEEFKKLVYGEYLPSETVVLFDIWGGISIESEPCNWRIPLSDPLCFRNKYFDDPFRNSDAVINDAKRYVDKYMPEAHKNGYTAVMLRLLHVRLQYNIDSLPKEEQLQKYMYCINKTLAEVKDMKRRYKIDSIFLAMDQGKYGAEEFRYDKEVLFTVAHNFYKSLFGNSSTLSDWEQSFDDISRFSEPGYIAVVQKIIAANSTCLLMAGGGGFQNSADQIYEQYHPRPSSRCSVLLKFKL